jgi:DNA topoisomerase-1
MEEKLDAVEEGQQDWRQILREFYPGFESTLALAEKEIEKVEVKDEVSNVPCDKCGAMMVYKMGRYGKFLACPNFPNCRNTKPILQYLDVPCPKCGKRLLVKTSRKNRRFYGCEGYPECDFVSWDRPAAEKCPKCGQYMIEKQNNKGEMIHLCTNENCRFKTIAQPQEDEAE